MDKGGHRPVVAFAVSLRIREVQRNGGDAGRFFDKAGEGEVTGLQVDNLGRLLVDRHRQIHPLGAELGGLGDGALEIKDLAGMGLAEFEVGVIGHPAVFEHARILEARILVEIPGKLADLRRPRQRVILFIGHDRDIADETDETAVIQVVPHAIEAHETGLRLEDRRRLVAEVDGDIGLIFVVLGLDDGRKHTRRAMPDERQPIVILADHDGIGRQLGAAFAE